MSNSTFEEPLDWWFHRRFGAWGLLGLSLLGLAALSCRNGEETGSLRLLDVAVARLEGDEGRQLEKYLVEALSESEGSHVIQIDSPVMQGGSVSEEDVRTAQARARESLEETGADVLLWGTVIQVGGQSTPKLYWTASRDLARAKQWERYTPEELTLPPITRDDLGEVLHLLVLTRSAEVRAEQGQSVADRLEPSIEKVRHLLEGSSGWNAEERASMKVILADALAVVGEQSAKSARLEQAVASYRASLEEMPREIDPQGWAMAQNNLGGALRTLGEREGSAARVEEAVEAYRAVLEVRTREFAPLDWASTQNNLGNALRTLGEWEGSAARVEEAVAAHRAALEEWTRERAPLDWAKAQHNLGYALFTLGELEGGTARLEEAVAANRAALEECTRERMPLDWAMTQHNLGMTLALLGEREGNVARVEEAVAVYRAALEVRTRERVPLDWAQTQHNLGSSLFTLGELEKSTARLEEAVAAYRAALKERTREFAPLDWAMTQTSLGMTLAQLGEREGNMARAAEAVAAYRAALKERTREREPLQWAATQALLGAELLTIGLHRGVPAVPCEALHRHLMAWEVFSGAEAGAGRAASIASVVQGELEHLRVQGTVGLPGLSACLKEYGEQMANRLAMLDGTRH